MVFDHIEEKEAVKKAALIERNGIAFYTLMAEKITDERIRPVLKRLASDEKRHLKVIEEKFFEEAGFGDVIDEEELEIEKYVERLGTPDIFTRRINIEKLVSAIDEPRKALILAMNTERHSVEFFESMAGKAATEDGKKMYRELAEEEREHVRHIEDLLRLV